MAMEATAERRLGRPVLVERRRDRLHLAREAGWGKMSWLAVAGGVFVTFGMLALALGVATAIAYALHVDSGSMSSGDWKHLGIGATAVGALVCFAAFYFGAYVAGRMARRAGFRNGIAAGVVTIVALAVTGVIAWSQDAGSAAIAQLRGLRMPTDWDTWSTIGLAAAVALIAAMIIGSLLGGARGERWHERLVVRALDPAVGPEADLRAEAEARRRAAEAAEARANRATGTATMPALAGDGRVGAATDEDEEHDVTGAEWPPDEPPPDVPPAGVPAAGEAAADGAPPPPPPPPPVEAGATTARQHEPSSS